MSGADTPQLELRLSSSRAPYRRARIAFTSTSEPVTVPLLGLTVDQAERLAADPVISARVAEVGSGGKGREVADLVALVTEAHEAEAARAKAAGKADAAAKKEAQAKAKAEAEADAPAPAPAKPAAADTVAKSTPAKGAA